MNRLKLLIASSVVVTLSGCSLIDAYLMANYDNNEYGLVNKVRTISEISVEDCKDYDKTKLNISKIYGYSVELKNFSQHIPDNPEAAKLGNNLVELSKQLKEHYAKNSNVSEAFCKLKLQQISRSSEVAQKVIGRKPR